MTSKAKKHIPNFFNRGLWKRIQVKKRGDVNKRMWRWAYRIVAAADKVDAEAYDRHRFMQSRINAAIQGGFFTRSIPETEEDDWWMVSFDDSRALRFYGHFCGRNCDKCGGYITGSWCGDTKIKCECYDSSEGVLFEHEEGGVYCPHRASRDCGCDNALKEREREMYEIHNYIMLIQKWWRKAKKA